MSVRARSIVVTGANRGIGLEMIKQLVASDTPPQILIATCRDPGAATDLNKIAQDHSAVQVVKLDIRNQAEYPSFVEQVRSKVGDKGLNLLINNAGIFKQDDLTSVTWEDMMNQYETNVVATLFITRAILPLLRQAAKQAPSESGLTHTRAAVFNLSTNLASISGNDWGAVYAYRSSKCALNMVTMSLHRDLSPEGILIAALHPGWVQTRLGGKDAPTTTPDCVKGLFKVISEARDAQAGSLITFEGKTLAW